MGCIYTAQGFEYDYSGVIFGPDLVWRDVVWVADRKSSKDTVVASAREHEFAHLIRNTYKVLLTRGMQEPCCSPPTPKPGRCSGPSCDLRKGQCHDACCGWPSQASASRPSSPDAARAGSSRTRRSPGKSRRDHPRARGRSLQIRQGRRAGHLLPAGAA
ncbi:DNA/RNA helicase domain-containing protein [Streptomyces sp. NPDC015684]|uniref:DNA/RNA helicase domain-containing protein n=1 Tax=Streptomyces sp. NPDC015684 TaxID=3364963 RepID=UPI00370141D8